MRRLRILSAAVLVLALAALSTSARADTAVNTRLIGSLDPQYRAVCADGNFAYVGETWVFIVFDLSTSINPPVWRGNVVLPEWIEEIYVSNGLAYVADGPAGLQIIDVANPGSPQIRGSYPTSGFARDVYTTGGLAYVANGPAGLLVLDVTDPSSPTLRGECRWPGDARGVAVRDGLVYVADGASGLKIIWAGDPSTPVVVGSHDFGAAFGIWLANGLAYMAAGASGLKIINVSNPTSPTLLGSCDTSGFAVDVVTSGTFAYIADGPGGLQTVNVANPISPTLCGRILPQDYAFDVCLQGGLAYVGNGWRGILIANVTNTSQPVQSGIYPRYPHAYGIHAMDEWVFLATWACGLKVIDISNASAPRVVSVYQTQRAVYCVIVHEGLVYVGGEEGLTILDVENPSSPILRATYRTAPYCLGVYARDGMAYTADYTSGIHILDVSNPSSPALCGSHGIVGEARNICVSGDLAYVASMDFSNQFYNGLSIIDVSDPSVPRWRAFYQEWGAIDVSVTGRTAYLAQLFRLDVFDVTNPTRPVWRRDFSLENCFNAHVSRGLAYCSGRGSLRIIDVTGPDGSPPSGSYPSPDYCNFAHYADGLVFFSTDRGGLRIVQYTPRAPRVMSADYNDSNNNMLVDRGDQIVLTMDRSITVTTSAIHAEHFFLPVQNDSLGGDGFSVGVNPYSGRQIVLTLGQGARLTRSGVFSMQNRAAGSPSGIDVATSFPFNAVRGLDGNSALDGGALGRDDSAVDIRFNLIRRQADIGVAGGAIKVAANNDAAYWTHQLTLPPGALATTATFLLRPPEQNLGVVDAMQIVSTPPAPTFAASATLRMEYRLSDWDRERGCIESEIRVHQLVENPLGVLQYAPLAGPHTVNRSARQVSAEVRKLNPRGSLGAPRVFAALPVALVEERAIYFKPGGTGSVVLTPGPDSAYPLHKIEIPNHILTTAGDPVRKVMRIRPAMHVERTSLCEGTSFPAQSGAVFTVTVSDAAGKPVRFRSPVHITVQFKQRPDAWETDVVRFDGSPAPARHMEVVRDIYDGEAASFGFAVTATPEVNLAAETVTIRNFRNLTHYDGIGTFGAVARNPSTRVARWQSYR